MHPGHSFEYFTVIVSKIIGLTRFIHSFILVRLTKGSQHLPKLLSHRVRSNVYSSYFKYPPPLSLRISSSCLRLLPLLTVISTFPCVFPSKMCFRGQFPRKIWQTQIVFLLSTVRRMFLSYAILHFLHDRPNWSFPYFSSTTFQNSSSISDLLSDVSKFQHRIKLCSRCTTCTFFPKFKSSLLVERPFLDEGCFCHDNPYWKQSSINIKK